MWVYWKVFIAVLETLLTLGTEILFGFIFGYLRQKQFRSSFDLVCKQTIVLVMIQMLGLYFVVLLALLAAPVSYFISSILIGALDIISILVISSTFMTLIWKYLYIFRTSLVNELSNKQTLTFSSLGISLLTILTFVSSFLGPIQVEHPFFVLLTQNSDLESPIPIGIGMQILLASVVILALIMQWKIERLNAQDGYETSYKNTLRILLCYFLGFVSTALFTLFFVSDKFAPFILTVTSSQTLIGCIPLTIIFRNPNLKKFVFVSKSCVNKC